MRIRAGVCFFVGLLLISGQSYAGVTPDNLGARGMTVEPLSRDQMASAGFRSPESAGLFIGVREFRDNEGKPADGIAEIPFAVDDAIDLAHLFALELKLLPPERVTLALSGEPVSAKSKTNLAELLAAKAERVNANFTTLLKQIRNVSRRAGRNGLLIISAATHGYSLKGEDRLFGRDSTLSDIELTGVPVRSLLDEERQNGVFTLAVIAGLRGEAPPDDRGFITTQTLAGYVDGSVKEWVKRKRPKAADKAGIGINADVEAGRIPLAVNPVKLKETEKELGRRKELIDVLRKHIDFKTITAKIAEEMALFLEEAPAGSATELVHRLEILERMGPAYSQDFAMWWGMEGGNLRAQVPPSSTQESEKESDRLRNDIIARVGERYLTLSEVHQLDPEGDLSPEDIGVIVENWIDKQLLLKVADKMGIPSNSSIRLRIDFETENIILEALGDRIRDETMSDKEAQSELRRHIEAVRGGIEVKDFFNRSNDKGTAASDNRNMQSFLVKPIPINSVTAEELAAQGIVGLGFTTAQKIIEYRDQRGPFSSYDDLDMAPRVGDLLLERLKEVGCDFASSNSRVRANQRSAVSPKIEDGLKLNINSASVEELSGIAGISHKDAEAVVAYRLRHGPFRTIDELDYVRGFGPEKIAGLLEAITVR